MLVVPTPGRWSCWRPAPHCPLETCLGCRTPGPPSFRHRAGQTKTARLGERALKRLPAKTGGTKLGTAPIFDLRGYLIMSSHKTITFLNTSHDQKQTLAQQQGEPAHAIILR